MSRRPSGALRALVAAGALAVVGAAGWWVGGLRAPHPPDAERLTRLMLTLEGDFARVRFPLQAFYIPFAVSPGGERIVFRGRGSGKSQLFLRELSRFDIKPLDGTETATSPFFSPDGKWVGFWRAEDRILRRVSISGGSPIEIAPTDSVHAASWMDSGEIVFDTGVQNAELWSVSELGGQPRPIVVRDRVADERIALRSGVPGTDDLLVASMSAMETWLDLLSRETGRRRHVLRAASNLPARFTRTGHLLYTDADALFAVPVDRRLGPVGPPVPVLPGIDHYYQHSNVALAEDGTVAYLPAEQVREPEIAWLDATGTVTPVAGGRGPIVSLRLSPDGKAAAAELVSGTHSQVWILDLERGTRRLLTGDRQGGHPIWSRDGRTITYVSDEAQRSQGSLCRMPADGTAPEECFARVDRSAEPEDWSPDGRVLLFNEYTKNGDSDVWMYADGKTTPLIGGAQSQSGATFSPDGRFIAFEADDGGVSRVYVQPSPGPGPRTTISAEGAGSPRWSADRGHLLFWSGTRIVSVPVETYPALRVGDPKVIVEASSGSTYAGMSPDETRFLVWSPRRTEGPPELRVVSGWFKELEHLAPHPR